MSAKGRGMPSVPNLILPHPYETLSEEQVRAIAKKAFDLTTDALLIPGRNLAEVPNEEAS